MLGKPLLLTVLIFSIFNGGIKALTLPTEKVWDFQDARLYCLTRAKGNPAAGSFVKACVKQHYPLASDKKMTVYHRLWFLLF